MFNLLNMVQNGYETLSAVISTHVRNKGKALVTEISADSGSTATASSPVAFVHNLIQLKDQCDELLLQAFENDRRFKQLIAGDFESFLNQNDRSPEYLSLFVDEKLKRGSKGVRRKTYRIFRWQFCVY